MNKDEEHDVVRGLRNGDAHAWRALYDTYCRQVWQAVARMMGPNASDVADVVQETFMSAARSACRYDPERGSLWVWLCGIARNQAALHFRKQVRAGRSNKTLEHYSEGGRKVIDWLDGRDQSPADILQSAELAEMVRSALTKLPVDYEAVLTAKYLDGASVEQIAGDQQCSVVAVRSRLARARQAFRELFLKTCDGSGTD
jgi:RNA polymerase sigma-70 factor, ECF subfamily